MHHRLSQLRAWYLVLTDSSAGIPALWWMLAIAAVITTTAYLGLSAPAPGITFALAVVAGFYLARNQIAAVRVLYAPSERTDEAITKWLVQLSLFRLEKAVLRANHTFFIEFQRLTPCAEEAIHRLEEIVAEWRSRAVEYQTFANTPPGPRNFMGEKQAREMRSFLRNLDDSIRFLNELAKDATKSRIRQRLAGDQANR